VAILLFAAAAVCSFAANVQAAIDVDFNGEGVIDRVVLPRPHETNIVVRLSGAAPQVLRLHDRIIAIVATDINHDGEIDLSALSERRGVFIWLNKGKAGHGHLKAVKRHHRPVQFSLNTRGPLASAPSSASEGPAAAGPDDDRDWLAEPEPVTTEFNPRLTLECRSQIAAMVSDNHGGVCSSRAPPLSL